jgi:double-stranded uracil-DNA glycosylase
MKSEQVNLRLEHELVEALEEAAREESLDRATMMRRLLLDALRQWRITKSLSGYQSGELSLGRAAEEANVSQWDLMELARRSGIAYPLDAETVERRLEGLRSQERPGARKRPAANIRESLPDIRPRPGCVLLVGINPAPVSVRARHYYQGTIGKRLWRRLESVNLVRDPVPGAEDEAFAQLGHGMTDLVKRPTVSSADLTNTELNAGVEELKRKIRSWRPGLVIFPFKKVASVVLGPHVSPGPGPDLEGAPTFLLTGPYAPREETKRTDAQLRRKLKTIGL